MRKKLLKKKKYILVFLAVWGQKDGEKWSKVLLHECMVFPLYPQSSPKHPKINRAPEFGKAMSWAIGIGRNCDNPTEKKKTTPLGLYLLSRTQNGLRTFKPEIT